jgi:hypothetical protein
LNAEQKAWQQKRDDLYHKWTKAKLWDTSLTWAKSCTQEAKVTMCLEACEELGYTMQEFNSRTAQYLARRQMQDRKAKLNKRKRKLQYYDSCSEDSSSSDSEDYRRRRKHKKKKRKKKKSSEDKRADESGEFLIIIM